MQGARFDPVHRSYGDRIGQAASSATMGRQGRKARARSFQMEALGLPSRNVNLALTSEVEQDSRFSRHVAFAAM